jgi:carbon-monoxide dehydrogenase large subunit
VANIRLDLAGAVTGSFGVASHGQGLETTLAQVIADELGARIEDNTRILHGDCAVVAHGTGTYASRSAVLASGAATLASRLHRSDRTRAHWRGRYGPASSCLSVFAPELQLLARPD